MQLKENEAPIASDFREELQEKKKIRLAPGTKLILGVVVTGATAMVGYGVLSSAGVFGDASKTSSKRQHKATPEPTAPKAPRLNLPPIPTSTQPNTSPAPSMPGNSGFTPPAGSNAMAGNNVCPNGQRLPDGMPLSMCPGNGGYQSTQGSAAGPGNTNKPPSKYSLTAEQLRERRLNGDLSVAAAEKDERGGSYPGGIPNMAGVPGMPGMPTSTTAPNLLGGAGRNTGTGAEPGTLGAQLVATETPTAIAKLQLNRSLTLGKGALPDCTLLTAIRTTQGGFVRCVLSQPVYSMNGDTVLMEPGTQVNGEYQQGIKQGQRAIFTVWTDAVTPYGVKIQLNSPGTDELGRSGTSGYVDNKWIERYAGAVFYSFFDDLMSIQLAKSQNAGNNNVSLYPNSSGAAKSIVEEMLKDGSQVKPDMYKLQGETVRIFVARDVDFSTVYQLRSKRQEF